MKKKKKDLKTIMKDLRSPVVSVRVPSNLLSLASTSAKWHGMTLPQWIRFAIESLAQRELIDKKQASKIRRDLRKI